MPPADPANADMLGTVGRYELLRRLGRGGMGEVYLARSRGAAGFEKRVVVKRILPHLADSPDFVTRFIDEGKLVVQLHHAGIAQVLDLGEADDGTMYLAMEYVDGRDLRELLRLARAAGAGLPIDVAVEILVQILRALDYAHHATGEDGRPLGIVHRDVSPSNVMISRSGEVKIVDFGMARAAERSAASVSGAIQGKFAYMAPEQATGGALDGRADQFAVGVTAWEMLAGRRPFDGDSDLETLDRIRTHDPGPLSETAPEVPEPVAEVVDRLLAKDPEDRFDAADDAARALQGWLAASGYVGGTREVARWVEEVVPPELRDRPGAMSLDDALLLGLQATSDGPVTASALSPVAQGTAATSPASPTSSPDGLVTVDRPLSQPAEPRRRSVGVVVLVLANLALLAAVAILLWQATQSGPVTPTAPTVNVITTPEDARTSPAPLADAVAHTEVSEEAEVAPAPAREEDPAGRVAGRALASVDDAAIAGVQQAERVNVTIRPVPSDAVVTIAGRGTWVGGRTVSVSKGDLLRVHAKRDGYEPKSFSVRVQKPRAVPVRLKRMETGSVKFRFYPAAAEVKIDGKVLATGPSNVVDRKLPVGEHRLTLRGPDGRRRVVKFTIQPDKRTNLGTIELPEGPGDAP